MVLFVHIFLLQHGEVDCWPMPCAPLTDCEFVAVPDGECCPRCISDPCQADTLFNDVTKTCVDEHGATRLSGSTWNKHATECSICQCKVRHTQLHTALQLFTTASIFIFFFIFFTYPNKYSYQYELTGVDWNFFLELML